MTWESIEVLMAEDDEGDQILVRKAFARSRAINTLTIVNDGEELMRYLRREPPYAEARHPDLLLLDLNMPKKDGREALAEIKAEAPGNYYVGRRYYKVDYKFWGYIRKPGQPWSEAKLVMLNENKRLAPDREGGTLGTDNGYEYKLFGSFSGDTVYEPSSNGFYPEFTLTGYEVRNTNPAPIFNPLAPALDPARNVIITPY